MTPLDLNLLRKTLAPLAPPPPPQHKRLPLPPLERPGLVVPRTRQARSSSSLSSPRDQRPTALGDPPSPPHSGGRPYRGRAPVPTPLAAEGAPDRAPCGVLVGPVHLRRRIRRGTPSSPALSPSSLRAKDDAGHENPRSLRAPARRPSSGGRIASDRRRRPSRSTATPGQAVPHALLLRLPPFVGRRREGDVVRLPVGRAPPWPGGTPTRSPPAPDRVPPPLLRRRAFPPGVRHPTSARGPRPTKQAAGGELFPCLAAPKFTGDVSRSSSLVLPRTLPTSSGRSSSGRFWVQSRLSPSSTAGVALVRLEAIFQPTAVGAGFAATVREQCVCVTSL